MTRQYISVKNGIGEPNQGTRADFAASLGDCEAYTLLRSFFVHTPLNGVLHELAGAAQ